MAVAQPSSDHGRLAQLVEHLVYTERVGSSSLSSPTMILQMLPDGHGQSANLQIASFVQLLVSMPRT